MSNTLIRNIHAREVFDSRGRPTVEVEITCETGRPGRAIVPSGASTGQFEALELRDGDPLRLDGLGVRRAVAHVNHEISQALIGRDAQDQRAIDETLRSLDGTSNLGRLGANAILGASLANAYAAAEANEISVCAQIWEIWQADFAPTLVDAPDPIMPSRGITSEKLGRCSVMPMPMVNMISGGLHAGRNLDFQDYLIIPVGATSYAQAFDWIVTVYRRLGQQLSKAGFEGVLVGDEGGYGPKLTSNEQALEFIMRATEASQLTPGKDIAIALDVASTHFYHDGTYQLAATGSAKLRSDDVIDLLENWVERYPIISIEDGLAEEDWSGWQRLTQRLGDRVQLIGDDLFVTNVERLQRGINSGVANSVLIKLNQIGTLTATLEAMRLALDNGYSPIVSARSGETEDTTIADLVVATGAGQLKVGSVARSERLAKYNQLLRLSENPHFSYLGPNCWRPGFLRW